jgi:hypothetical protein
MTPAMSIRRSCHADRDAQSFFALPTFEDPNHDHRQEYQGKE